MMCSLVISNTTTATVESLIYEGIKLLNRSWPAVSHNWSLTYKNKTQYFYAMMMTTHISINAHQNGHKNQSNYAKQCCWFRFCWNVVYTRNTLLLGKKMMLVYLHVNWITAPNKGTMFKQSWINSIQVKYIDSLVLIRCAQKLTWFPGQCIGSGTGPYAYRSILQVHCFWQEVNSNSSLQGVRRNTGCVEWVLPFCPPRTQFWKRSQSQLWANEQTDKTDRHKCTYTTWYSLVPRSRLIFFPNRVLAQDYAWYTSHLKEVTV